MPITGESISHEIGQLLEAARQPDASESYTQEQCSKALSKVELLKEIKKNESDPKILHICHYQILYFLCNIHILQKDYDKALEQARLSEGTLRSLAVNRLAVESSMRALDRFAAVRDVKSHDKLYDKLLLMIEKPFVEPTIHITVALQVANIQVLQEDWHGVKATLGDLMVLYVEGPHAKMAAEHLSDIFTGMSRCAYKLGEYEVAIKYGKSAIAWNRHFPASHQFLVLAHLESANKQREAQQYAAEAVLFETPWNKEHHDVTKDFYRQHFLK